MQLVSEDAERSTIQCPVAPGPPAAALLAAVTALVVIAAAGCGEADPGASPSSLSGFRVGQVGTARVVENVSACVVDGVCSLTLEYSDTTVVAVYGGGERAAGACPIGIEVSDAAFALEEGDEAEVLLGECEELGLILEAVGPSS
jgi:hypothetical protein